MLRADLRPELRPYALLTVLFALLTVRFVVYDLSQTTLDEFLVISLFSLNLLLGSLCFRGTRIIHFYGVDYSSLAGRIASVWAALVFGLSMSSMMGLVFQSRIALLAALPFAVLLGYSVGAGIIAVLAGYPIPIHYLVRLWFICSTLFGAIFFFHIAFSPAIAAFNPFSDSALMMALGSLSICLVVIVFISRRATRTAIQLLILLDILLLVARVVRNFGL